MKRWSAFLLLSVLLLLDDFAVVAVRFDDDDSSCSSESWESGEGGGGHGGHGGHHGGGGHHHHPHPRPPPGPSPPSPPSNRPRCDQNWFTLYRPQGIWCLRVGIGHMDYNGAIAQCATYGGVLSGIQNDEERMLVANEAIRQLAAYNVMSAGVWLGAQRNADNTISWTDGHTTGTAGFVWGPNEPDNSNSFGPQNCVQLLALSPGYWNNPGGWRNWQNGQMDDYWCDRNDDPPNRMYACGKRGPSE